MSLDPLHIRIRMLYTEVASGNEPVDVLVSVILDSHCFSPYLLDLS